MAQIKKTEAYTVPTGKINRLREQARIESLRKDKIITNSEAEKLSDEIWEAGNKSLFRIITKLSFSEWIYIIRTFFEFLDEEKQLKIKEIYNKYYTYQGALNNIIQNLNEDSGNS
jgi:hypothetical protein